MAATKNREFWAKMAAKGTPRPVHVVHQAGEDSEDSDTSPTCSPTRRTPSPSPSDTSSRRSQELNDSDNDDSDNDESESEAVASLLFSPGINIRTSEVSPDDQELQGESASSPHCPPALGTSNNVQTPADPSAAGEDVDFAASRQCKRQHSPSLGRGTSSARLKRAQHCKASNAPAHAKLSPPVHAQAVADAASPPRDDHSVHFTLAATLPPSSSSTSVAMHAELFSLPPSTATQAAASGVNAVVRSTSATLIAKSTQIRHARPLGATGEDVPMYTAADFCAVVHELEAAMEKQVRARIEEERAGKACLIS
ncbi:hypothetical protein JCM10295v2_006577 [Rhodotorula toruloides]